MKIRFLEAVQSEHPEYPFGAGQVIDVACPSPYLQSLLDDGRAEAVPTDDDSEFAVELIAERPEPMRKKGRDRARE